MGTLQLFWDLPCCTISRPWALVSDEQRGDMAIVLHTELGNAISRVYEGVYGCVRQRLTVKAALKLAIGSREIEEMDNEVGYYRYELKALQGKAVPQLFGHYRGTVDGLEIACMVMELLEGPGPGDKGYAQLQTVTCGI
jgi:hypothetical protein